MCVRKLAKCVRKEEEGAVGKEKGAIGDTVCKVRENNDLKGAKNAWQTKAESEKGEMVMACVNV